jgi:putative nucleotidyltransferase with HDIG domain
MLKKISTHQLAVGMFVHQLCGSWLDHPFWKKTFLVTEAKQLDLVRRSGIAEVWIDTSKGLDVPMEETDVSALETMIATMLLTPDPPPTFSDIGPCSLDDELERAGRIVAQGRGAMKLMFQDVRLGKAIDTEHCLPLVHDITQSIDRNPGAIVSLARLKTSDDYTYMHSVAVCALMIALARKLRLSEADTREAGVAGLIHDIGKAAMPSEILGKPGALTADEYAIMQRHPQAGHDMLVEARGVGDIPLDVCLHHHEKLDGRGYPHGLAGDAISLMARMGAVCDVYDAITSNRPYKAGWDPAMSIQKMAQWSREGHFDDAVLQAFVKIIGIYPIGSLVRLESERIAVVVDQSHASLLKPVVRTIVDVATRQACEPQQFDLSAPGCRERIVSRETAQVWGLVSVDDHWRLPSPIITQG